MTLSNLLWRRSPQPSRVHRVAIAAADASVTAVSNRRDRVGPVSVAGATRRNIGQCDAVSATIAIYQTAVSDAAAAARAAVTDTVAADRDTQLG